MRRPNLSHNIGHYSLSCTRLSTRFLKLASDPWLRMSAFQGCKQSPPPHTLLYSMRPVHRRDIHWMASRLSPNASWDLWSAVSVSWDGSSIVAGASPGPCSAVTGSSEGNSICWTGELICDFLLFRWAVKPALRISYQISLRSLVFVSSEYNRRLIHAGNLLRIFFDRRIYLTCIAVIVLELHGHLWRGIIVWVVWVIVCVWLCPHPPTRSSRHPMEIPSIESLDGFITGFFGMRVPNIGVPASTPIFNFKISAQISY